MAQTAEIRAAVETAERFAAQLHAMPEESFHEVRTTKLVRDFCISCGAALVDLGMETGAAAYLDCGRAKTVALRADLDAVTTEAGTSHVCGHDHHTASLLGAMQALCAQREALPCNVAFLFQPGEECTQGAQAMLRHGLLQKLPRRPDGLFGIHNRPEIAVGKIGVHPGPLMAEKTNFTVTFVGKTGHGGSPHRCVDPLMPAAQLILGAQTIIGRNVDPFDAAVCSVCSIHAGTPDNFAPAEAVLTGSVRTLLHTTQETVLARLRCLTEQSAACYDCGCRTAFVREVPALVNGPEMTAAARRAAIRTVGAENLVDPQPCLGSEDFSVFGQEIPSFFYWVGSGRTGSAGWHSPAFHVEDGYQAAAVPLLVNSVLEF